MDRNSVAIIQAKRLLAEARQSLVTFEADNSLPLDKVKTAALLTMRRKVMLYENALSQIAYFAKD